MAATTAVDILIIGAGPAGLALANWLRYSDISVMLVDRKPGPTPRGQAEGLKSTTNEILGSFGIGSQIAAESWRLEEIAVWGPGGSGIVREQVVQDKAEELGTVRETLLQQCVVDLIPKTNFPDIRRVCYLRAATGTILSVPRSNKEIRLYIPVESGTALPNPKDLTLARIMSAAQQIIAPYTLEAGPVSWWSAYRVGQRVGSHFSRHNERAFLVGDAVHTHSPKAGQGMNTSIQDAYNLGWKLRLVLQGRVRSAQAAEALLRTYETERRPVAQDLIAFDKGYLKLFSASSAQFDTEFLRAMKFTTGISIRYPKSCVVQMPRDVDNLGPSLLKADLVPGKRLQDAQVVYHADGTTTRIQKRMQATGAFRLVVFAGEIADQGLWVKLQSLGKFLADREAGLGLLTTPSVSDGSVAWQKVPVEVLLVHCAERDRVNLLDLPEIFRPWSSDEGYDYWRVFADAESVHEGHGKVLSVLSLRSKKGVVLWSGQTGMWAR
ncbi:hypothetical protein N0V88_007562 [Collariella sp. IMI 366227]|nr:hypothetical protein N0V88_007562 [Collariella sp. IMI 366227]